MRTTSSTCSSRSAWAEGGWSDPTSTTPTSRSSSRRFALAALRRPGTTAEANVTILYPEALQVAIPNPGAGAKALRALLLGAIQETTSLDLVAVLDPPGDYLILTDPDKGLGKKLAKTL